MDAGADGVGRGTGNRLWFIRTSLTGWRSGVTGSSWGAGLRASTAMSAVASAKPIPLLSSFQSSIAAGTLLEGGPGLALVSADSTDESDGWVEARGSAFGPAFWSLRPKCFSASCALFNSASSALCWLLARLAIFSASCALSCAFFSSVSSWSSFSASAASRALSFLSVRSECFSASCALSSAFFSSDWSGPESSDREQLQLRRENEGTQEQIREKI